MSETLQPARRGVVVVAVLAVCTLAAAAVAGVVSAGDRGAVSAVSVAAVESITPSPTFSLVAATETALAARTVEFDLGVTMSGLGAFTVSGAVDNESGRAVVVGDLADLLPMGEDLPFGGDVQLIVDDNTLYVGASGLGELLPIDLPWVSIDLDVVAEKSGASSDDLWGSTMVDPVALARLLLDADDVADVGVEIIDGVETMRFRVTVDLTGALDAVPGVRDRIGDIDLPDELAYDVWVSVDNQLRRAALNVDAAGFSLAMVLDMTTSDDALDVAVPAEAFDLTAWIDW
jgi:hypothetical protein